MSRILVTGGMGFVGNHVVHRLLQLGHEVNIIDKSIYTPKFYEVNEAKVVEGDILSMELMHDLLASHDDCVHLAAISSVPLSHRDWIFSHETNVVGFNYILNGLMHINKPLKCIYASSAAVYGYCSAPKLSENLKVSPFSSYGVDKFSNELYASAVHQYAHIPTIGLRFFDIFGPGQLDGNSYSGVMAKFRNALLENQPLCIYGNGEQTRDFIYIDDVVNAVVSAINIHYETHGVFNVCTGKSVTINQLAKIIMNIMGKEVPLDYLPERKGEVILSCGDPTLAKEVLNFEAKISLEEGLARYLSI